MVVPNTSRYWLPVSISLLLVGWGANQFASMLAFYQQAHGFSQITVTSMLGIYVAGLIPALLMGGRFSDRMGRKGATIAALGITLVASVAMIFGVYSAFMIFLGRFMAGVATGIAMAAGTSWVKELSQAPWDPTASANSGARRASLFTTAGFWLGPIASGLIANYAPAPEVLPYVVHIVLCVPLFFTLFKLPDLRAEATPAASAEGPVERYAFAGGQQRFRRVVAPGAPWVFGAGTIGFAVVPSLLDLGEHALIYSTAAVALTLGFGVAVQSLARKLDTPLSARATLVAISISLVGLILMLVSAIFQLLWLGLIASSFLGAGYGLMLVAGLSETQRLSSPSSLGANTGKFYTLAYAGYLAPTVLAFLGLWFAPLTLVVVVLLLAVLSMVQIGINSRRFLPAPLGVS